jgi:ubiquinone/menaquinone biosynthesis C-methylase UbiE
VDDKKFDRKSAEEWIALIESEGAKIRDTDIYPLLTKWIWDNDITDVLDIGCGQGASSAVLPRITLYTGVDPSIHLVDRARILYPTNRFLEGSAYALPVQDASFEGAFSIAVWHLLSHIDLAAKELARVLKPNGHFLIVTADPQNEAWKKSHDVLHLRTESELSESLLKHNLKATEIGAFRSFWYFKGRKISS